MMTLIDSSLPLCSCVTIPASLIRENSLKSFYRLYSRRRIRVRHGVGFRETSELIINWNAFLTAVTLNISLHTFTKEVLSGTDVLLSCVFQLDVNETLYSLKWYKGQYFFLTKLIWLVKTVRSTDSWSRVARILPPFAEREAFNYHLSMDGFPHWSEL